MIPKLKPEDENDKYYFMVKNLSVGHLIETFLAKEAIVVIWLFFHCFTVLASLVVVVVDLIYSSMQSLHQLSRQFLTSSPLLSVYFSLSQFSPFLIFRCFYTFHSQTFFLHLLPLSLSLFFSLFLHLLSLSLSFSLLHRKWNNERGNAEIRERKRMKETEKRKEKFRAIYTLSEKLETF